jgi:uncharacterized damage-inducible protein DinB
MKRDDKLPEHWLRGPVTGIIPPLQPVAHALIQARDEVNVAMHDFPQTHLWDRPADVASVGFHLRHMAGVIDRLFTYARGEPLNDEQRAYLAAESQPIDVSVESLVANFSQTVDHALDDLRAIDDPEKPWEARAVGRLALPSTVAGLLFHSAEHTMRHLGQLLVTARVVAGGAGPTR